MSDYGLVNNIQTGTMDDSFIYMDNVLIMAQQHMTMSEAKIIRLAICQIAKGDKELREFTIPILELAELLDMDRNYMYREIREICDRLLKRTVMIEQNDPKQPWVTFQWVNRAQYDGRGMVTVKISEEIKKYVTLLENFYTKYDYFEIRPLTNFYALRLYELLTLHYNKSYQSQNIFIFDIETLRLILCKGNEYQRLNRFKDYILKQAIDQINCLTSLNVSFELIKVGRSYKQVKFTVSSKKILMDGLGNAALSTEEGYVEIVGIQSILKSTGLEHTFEVARSVYLAYGTDITRLMNNIIYITGRSDIANRIGYLISIASDNPSEGVKPAEKKKPKAKKDPLEPMSDERLKAYEEHEAAITDPGYMENLFKDWDDIDII